MIKDKKDVRAYINKFKCDGDGVNALGFISYHTFDKTKMSEGFESINDFFRKNFKINKRTIKYVDLTFDETDNMWLNIETIYDIELLDELIAFGIASGVLVENLLYRVEEVAFSPYNIELLNEDPSDLELHSEQVYIKGIKRLILPTSKLDVSEETLARYRKETIRRIYSPERKKELLMAWWDRGVDHPENREIFSQLLDQDIAEDLILLVFSLYSSGLTSANISELITRGQISGQLVFTHMLYKNASENGKKDIQEGVQEMLDAFDNIEKEKKKRLS